MQSEEGFGFDLPKPYSPSFSMSELFWGADEWTQNEECNKEFKIFGEDTCSENFRIPDHRNENHVEVKGKGLLPEPAQEEEEKTSKRKKKAIPWTKAEHRSFLLGLYKYGKGNWKSISGDYVPSRTPQQVASHAQKYYSNKSKSAEKRRRLSIFDIQIELPEQEFLMKSPIANPVRLPFPSMMRNGPMMAPTAQPPPNVPPLIVDGLPSCTPPLHLPPDICMYNTFRNSRDEMGGYPSNTISTGQDWNSAANTLWGSPSRLFGPSSSAITSWGGPSDLSGPSSSTNTLWVGCTGPFALSSPSFPGNNMHPGQWNML